MTPYHNDLFTLNEIRECGNLDKIVVDYNLIK